MPAIPLSGDDIHAAGFGEMVSNLIGWTYFLAWSISFYPQIILNYKRKSVQGLSLDFIYFNVYGFLCYSIFNLAFFFNNEIQRQYRERNDGAENLVRANDVLFAVHALILSSVALSQTLVYRRDHNQKISPAAITLIATSALGIAIVLAAIRFRYFEWIDLMYYLGFVKLAISFVKYVPQAHLNYQRQSTVGWSIHNILLDFTGGVLSLGQLFTDASLSGDWSGVTGDPVKFGLGFLSMGFDLLFMTQHYILYRDRTDFYTSSIEEERQRLISEGPKDRKGYGSDDLGPAQYA